MRKFDVHVCTISDQATPNYIPILNIESRPKIVILLVSQKMQLKAKAFREVLRHYCNNVKVEQIDIANELDLTSLKNSLFNKISELNILTEKVGFNITGGTKLMAIESYLLAKNLDCQPFYFDNNKILNLNIADNVDALVIKNEAAQHLVPKNMMVEDYLALHGYKVKNKPTKRNELRCQNTHELLEKLIQLSETERSAMSQLYGIISSNNPKQLKFNLNEITLHRALETVIELFEKYEIFTIEDNTIIFADEADKKFAHGGWFEEYVFNIVRGLEGIQDCLMNIDIIAEDQKDPKKTSNEVDVAYMKDNALYVIECKSRNYESKGLRNNDDIGNGDLYKLETLQKLGGLYTRKIFVSYLPVPKFMKDRADNSRIKLIQLDRYINLNTELSKQ